MMWVVQCHGNHAEQYVHVAIAVSLQPNKGLPIQYIMHVVHLPLYWEGGGGHFLPQIRGISLL